MAIGPSFHEELEAAGLGDVPVGWGSDGQMDYSRCSAEQEALVEAVLAAHNPNVSWTPPRKRALADLASATTIAQMKAALLRIL